MGKGASKPKISATPAPAATARQVDEDVRLKDAAKRRQRIAAAGRGGTILTQKQGLTTVGASLLGRST